MTISMYQASIPAIIHGLGNLSSILTKAAAYAEAKKIDPAVLVNARLYPDMFPLVKQVQIASDVSKGVARLAGVEVPSFPDTETTFAQLQERIAKTITFVKTLTPAQIDGSEDKTISLKAGSNQLSFTGQDYLLKFVLPNIYFHITATYAILRHNGLDIGKVDYLGHIQ